MAGDILPRVSGRLGSPIDLNVTFYRNGAPADPYAIRRISIYRSAVQAENLIAEFGVVCPTDPLYPSPISREVDSNNISLPGVFHLYWDVPAVGIPTPDTFFDVWHYIPINPTSGSSGSSPTSGSEPITCSELDDETLWQSCCNQFWLYPAGYFCDDGLTNIRLGFEPQDIKFIQPEVRTLEVGITPLPLYDYDYNKIAPIIPRLQAHINLYTNENEQLITNELMRIGIRQGTYRSNPFVLQYRLDTRRFLRGSYKYQIIIELPNGETRSSPYFNLQVS